MANALAQFGNDLHSGRRSFGFVNHRGRWLGIASFLVILAILVPVVKGGFNLGIEFRGGSEFTVSQVANTDISIGEKAIADAAPEASDVRVTNIAEGTIRAQMGQLGDDQTLAVGQALQDAYSVSADQVTSSFVGPTWGAGVTQQALIGLVWFIVLVMIGMALYFRTWKMSVSAIAGLVFTIVTTVGLYALVGFEITPSAIIGFLTVLSYSLYDTVVVFDKIRENTSGLEDRYDSTFGEQVNLAVNQTLVRSINTSIVGILPVGSILFIGSLLLGAGTLKDLSLALFVGIIIGTLGTLFVAAPAYAALRLGEKDIKDHAEKVARFRAGELVESDDQDVQSVEAAPVTIHINPVKVQ
ncbi:protein translocase subunit SecF [Rothia nasimurium]|uniref:protein translocase subunit SecF n=1 Tax=Rothia nasimurium TaxID=85336 RepID=UPI003B9F749D